MYREITYKAAQALHQLSSFCTQNTPLLACRRQCQRRPISVDSNFHAERSSPQTTGDLNISNYTILNTFKLHARRIWLFAVFPNALNTLSITNSTLTMIQSRTWTLFPTSNMVEPSQTWSLNHRHLLCRGQKHSPAPAVRWLITLLSHGNATLRVALGRNCRTIHTTR